jgi:hypothetical protein
MIEYELQEGDGVFTREAGKFPPKDRQLISQVGNEQVKKLTLFKYPISVSRFAKFIGALKQTPYDDLMHLGLVINDSYLTEKDAVLKFARETVPSKSIDIYNVPVTKQLTINELLENTRKRMGDERFSTYCALNSRPNCGNCQDYLKNMLDANGLSTSESTKFILQDLTQVAKNLPGITDMLSNVFTGAKAVINRLQEGEGSCGKPIGECRCIEGLPMDNFGLPKCNVQF